MSQCLDNDFDELLACVGLHRPTMSASSSLVRLATASSPYQAASKLLDWPRPVLLDSNQRTARTGRYSYFTADPFLTVKSRGDQVELTGSAGRMTLQADPFHVLAGLLRRYAMAKPDALPPFLGGAIGYFAYDLGRLLETLPATTADEGLPDLDVALYDWVLAADHLSGRNWLVATGLPSGSESAGAARLAAVQTGLACSPSILRDDLLPAPRLRSHVDKKAYLQAIRRAQDYIAAGDIYQVNLSHRLEGSWHGPTWPLYERLRAVSPVPYGAYLALENCTILSASPERFLRVDDGRVETRPIKGTRPRGVTADQDRVLAGDLQTSEKDRAENLMIVDLLRNDLGKVCRVGSVRVPQLFGLEGYANVWQLVSTITGELRPGLQAVDALQACFPGGSVTGCPKKRAMEIIEELEPVRRGIYCGAIGYLSFTGAMDTSIAIRTFVVTGNRLHLQVGGAIVADSRPEEEYAETLAKGQAGLWALGTEPEEW